MNAPKIHLDELTYESALNIWRFSPAGSKVFSDVKFMLRLAELKQQAGTGAEQISERVGHANQLQDD